MYCTISTNPETWWKTCWSRDEIPWWQTGAKPAQETEAGWKWEEVGNSSRRETVRSQATPPVSLRSRAGHAPFPCALQCWDGDPAEYKESIHFIIDKYYDLIELHMLCIYRSYFRKFPGLLVSGSFYIVNCMLHIHFCNYISLPNIVRISFT